MGTGVGWGDEGGYSSKDRMLKDLAEEGSKGWSGGSQQTEGNQNPEGTLGTMSQNQNQGAPPNTHPPLP